MLFSRCNTITFAMVSDLEKFLGELLSKISYSTDPSSHVVQFPNKFYATVYARLISNHIFATPKHIFCGRLLISVRTNCRKNVAPKPTHLHFTSIDPHNPLTRTKIHCKIRKKKRQETRSYKIRTFM